MYLRSSKIPCFQKISLSLVVYFNVIQMEWNFAKTYVTKTCADGMHSLWHYRFKDIKPQANNVINEINVESFHVSKFVLQKWGLH